MGKVYCIILLIAVLMPFRTSAQTMDCEQTIAYATEEFNAGHFYSIPSILNDCLKSFSREQRQRAFLLLTQTYLLLDDPIGAQKSYLEILLANPEFIADDQLHAIDIVYLSKKFTATPIFSWLVSAGTNVSPVRVIRDLEVGGIMVGEESREKYYLRPGYHVAAAGEFSYNENLNLRLGIEYLHTTYRSLSEDFQLDTKQFIDRQSWINFPLYVSIADQFGRYRPYGFVGYSVSWMLNDRGSIALEKVTRKELASGEGENTEKKIELEKLEVQSPDLNLIKRRNRLNHSVIFGAGLKYKIGLDFVFVELRYSIGLKNIADANNMYASYSYGPTTPEWVKTFEPTGAFTHVDDYFRLDNLAISFGFLRPLYKPRELKRARTKGVLRKIGKEK
jgi:hypothetical protein